MKTIDVCQLDFPPACYGQTLAEIEATVQKIIETIFRDPSGLIRSGVNGKTMKPLRQEDVTERELGVGGWWENACIPRQYKNLAITFEDTHQCDGRYLDGLVDKYAATKDPSVLENARRLVDVTHKIWEIAAETHPYGKGWMPKPYGGMNDISEMSETSVDQYSDITFGLQKYYDELANSEERAFLAEMFLSFADWWIDHNYTTSFQGRTVWWDRVHALAQAYFLYLFQLAYSLAPRKKYLDAFDYIFSLAENALVSKEGPYDGENFNHNLAGIVVEAMARIKILNPRLEVFCDKSIRNYIPVMIEAGVMGKAGLIAPIFNLKVFTAKYLTSAHEFCQDKELIEHIVKFLSEIRNRSEFYHVKRGLSLEDGVLERWHTDKNDYRDVFVAKSHSCWFAAYWYLRRHNKITKDQ